MAAKLAALRRPDPYPDCPRHVDVIETHMSWVFLTEQFVYKLKKPARYDGLDCSMLETRRFFCEEELRLNRRLAPWVYLGVVALRLDDQRLRIGSEGEVVEWLVCMRRLASHLTLDRLIEACSATPGHMRRAAEHLGAFYRGLAPAVTEPAPFAARLGGEIDTFERELSERPGILPIDEVTDLCGRLRQALLDCGHVLDARVRAGKIVEGHGDLRPEHVWLGDPIAIIDCLEFSAQLRTLDVADEIGFLALECERLGAPQLGQALFAAFAEFTGDQPKPELVGFYQAFRACVRATLAIRHLHEASYRDDPKWRARAVQYLALAAKRLAR